MFAITVISVLFLNIILCPLVLPKRRSNLEDLSGNLITSLRNEANLDLSVDEEYEDLRAELLAYHTALASLAEDVGKPEASKLPAQNMRRSMKSTPCWQLGGICINYKLCQGHKYLTQVPGCRNKLEVCCFSWNKVQIRDFRDKGIGNAQFPWPFQAKTGSKGLQNLGNYVDSKNLDVVQAFHLIKKDSLKQEEKDTFGQEEKNSLKQVVKNTFEEEEGDTLKQEESNISEEEDKNNLKQEENNTIEGEDKDALKHEENDTSEVDEKDAFNQEEIDAYELEEQDALKQEENDTFEEDEDIESEKYAVRSQPKGKSHFLIVL